MDNNNNNNFINPDNQPQNKNYNMPQQGMDYSGIPQNENYNYTQPQNADYSNMQQGMDYNYSESQQNMGYGNMQQNVNYNYSEPQQNMGYGNMQQNANYNYSQPQQSMDSSNMTNQALFSSQPNKEVSYSGKAKKLKKVKKSWSKGKIAAVSCGGAALVAGIACAIIFILVPMLKPAKDVVVDAFESTFDDVRENVYGEDIYGMQEILETYYTKGGDSSFTMSLDKLPETEGIDLTKYQLKSDGSYNPVDKLVNYSTAIRYGDEDIIGIDFIGTKDNTYFIVDELINGYFKLPNEDILNKLAASPIGQSMNLSDIPNYPVSIDYFPEINTASSTDGTEIVTEYVDAIEKLWDGVDVSKQGKAKINLHDDVVVATEYYLTFKEDDIEEALESYIDGLMSEAGTVGMLAGSTEGFDEETYKLAIAQLKSMVPSIISDDLVVRVYIKDGKVVKITSNPKGNIFGTELGCDFSMDITDTHVRIDTTVYVAGEAMDIVCDIKCEDGKTEGEIVFAVGGDSLSIKLDGTTVSDDSKLTDTMKIDMYENSVCVATINLNDSLDKKSNTFEGNATILSEGKEYLNLSYNGEITGEKGVSFGIKLDDMTVSCEGASFSVGSVNYLLDTSKVSAKDVDSSIPVYDVITLNEDDFAKIEQDNEERIMEWVKKISELDIFSALKEINPDKYEDSYDEDVWDVNNPYDEDTATDVEVKPLPDATDTDAAVSDASNSGDIIIKCDGSDVAVKLIKKPQGFEITDNNGQSVTFSDSDDCAIGFSMGIDGTVGQDSSFDVDAEAAVDFMESIFSVSEFESQTSKTVLNIDGDDVYYVAYSYSDTDKKYVLHLFAKDVDAGKPLIMLAAVADEHLTLDDLKQFMSSKTGYEMVK